MYTVIMIILTYIAIGVLWSIGSAVVGLIKTHSMSDEQYEELDSYNMIPFLLSAFLPWLWPYWVYRGAKWMWAEHKKSEKPTA